VFEELTVIGLLYITLQRRGLPAVVPQSSASEMTYIVSGGALNSTHSLTLQFFKIFSLYNTGNPLRKTTDIN